MEFVNFNEYSTIKQAKMKYNMIKSVPNILQVNNMSI